MNCEATDITEQTFGLLRRKRAAAVKHRAEFEAEGIMEWYDLLIAQTDCAEVPYEQFAEDMARYIYVYRR